MSLELRRANQRGSALLIVFVFAAMLAIMLYREMPVAAFEAQRQKEELLIDRGNEYKRAVKLYVRKFQTFPPSMEALENTNRMRFLRNRFVDPYSGKADWRLLHAGPGGIIIDSKIKRQPSGLNGSDSKASANPFGNSGGLGGASTASNPFDSTAATFPQRPPAVSLNGAGPGNADMIPGMPVPGPAPDAQQTDAQQPTPAVPNPAIPYPGYPGPPTAPIPGQTSSQPDSSQSGPVNPLASASGVFPVPPPNRFRNAGPTGNSYPPGQFSGQNPGDPASQQGNPQDPQSMMNALLNNQNPQPTAQTGTFTSAARSGTPPLGGGNSQTTSNTTTVGGGIAGVASKANGHTIKVLNDQTERTLWEFVYDMQAEATANAPTLGNSTGANGGINGASNTQGNASGFNSPNQSNTFGNGFGNSSAPNRPSQTSNP